MGKEAAKKERGSLPKAKIQAFLDRVWLQPIDAGESYWAAKAS